MDPLNRATDPLSRATERIKLHDHFQLPVSEILHSPLLKDKQITLTLIRLDTIHPEISGNKWFKLKENIRCAKASGKRQLLSFGGAHSNHLAAIAVAAPAFGMDSIGLVRGWHGRDKPTPTLLKCRQGGMQLHFLSREHYAKKESTDFLKQLKAQYPKAWIIPEGGNNSEGRNGASEIAAYIPSDADYIVLPVGTGTTLAGIRRALPGRQHVLGMVPFKQKAQLEEQIGKMLDQNSTTRRYVTPMLLDTDREMPDSASSKRFHLCNDYHFGGFAKSQPELIDFMNRFYQTHDIPLDFIYTGKMLYGLMDLISRDHFPPGSRLCALHTGGLQGNQSRQDLSY